MGRRTHHGTLDISTLRPYRTRTARASGYPCRGSRASRATDKRSTNCMRLTGRRGFRRKGTRGTGRQTTRAWCSSVWTCTRRRSSKSISRNRRVVRGRQGVSDGLNARRRRDAPHRAVDGRVRRTALAAISVAGLNRSCYSNGRDHHRAACSAATASVGVRNGRVEIDGVARFERALFAVDMDAQGALDDVDELDARMLVRL